MVFPLLWQKSGLAECRYKCSPEAGPDWQHIHYPPMRYVVTSHRLVAIGHAHMLYVLGRSIKGCPSRRIRKSFKILIEGHGSVIPIGCYWEDFPKEHGRRRPISAGTVKEALKKTD